MVERTRFCIDYEEKVELVAALSENESRLIDQFLYLLKLQEISLGREDMSTDKTS